MRHLAILGIEKTYLPRRALENAKSIRDSIQKEAALNYHDLQDLYNIATIQEELHDRAELQLTLQLMIDFISKESSVQKSARSELACKIAIMRQKLGDTPSAKTLFSLAVDLACESAWDERPKRDKSNEENIHTNTEAFRVRSLIKIAKSQKESGHLDELKHTLDLAKKIALASTLFSSDLLTEISFARAEMGDIESIFEQEAWGSDFKRNLIAYTRHLMAHPLRTG